MNKEHLEQIVDLFILSKRRSRFLDLLSGKKRYADFLHALLRDTRYFDPQCIMKVERSKQTAVMVCQDLVEMGAKGRVYIVSSDYELDGVETDLVTATAAIVGTMSESMIFCPQAELGYFEGHEGWRLILKSKSLL